MASPLRVWFNHGSSSIQPVLRSLSLRTGRVVTLLTHGSDDFGPQADCDRFEVEPRGLSGESYVRWCLAYCRAKGIDVFVPARRRDRIADAEAEFLAQGTRLVVAADGGTLRLLESKADMLSTLPAGVPTPRFWRAADPEQFRAAVSAVRDAGGTPCFKPAKSTFGIGFHVLDERMTPARRLLSSEPTRISTAEAIACLSTERSFPELLVMEYLKGPEFSVDVAANNGRIIAMVVRRKPQAASSFAVTSRAAASPSTRSQTICRESEIEGLTELLVRHYRLRGLCNVQFRRRSREDRCPYLLEINGRMSGGIGYSTLCGVDLVWIAICGALGIEDDSIRTAPATSLPMRVQERTEFFRMPSASV
jgi:biotin carboxylase